MKRKFKSFLAALFTIAIVFNAMPMNFALADTAEEAFLAYAEESWTYAYWGGEAENGIVATNATITGVGQYKVGLDFTGTENGKAQGLAFTAPMINNGEAAFPGYIMTIDAIEVNGAPIEFTKNYTNNEEGKIRTNVYNAWVSELPADARTADGNLDGASPTIIDPALFAEVETVFVTFTLSEGDGAFVPAEEAEYVLPSEFPAFLMFADDNWNWQNMKIGTAGDTVVLGDGTYTVYVSKDSLKDITDTSAQAVNAHVFNIDIEGLGDAMKHIGKIYNSTEDGCEVEVSLEVYVDGNKINVKNSKLIYGDLENNGKFRIEIYNTYGSGTKDDSPLIPEAVSPEEEIKVVFTLKGTGFNTEAAAAAEAEKVAAAEKAEATPTPVATETTAEADAKEDGPNFVLIIVIVAAVIVVGAVVVVVLKKKKA